MNQSYAVLLDADDGILWRVLSISGDTVKLENEGRTIEKNIEDVWIII